MYIRRAALSDLDEIAAIERICFPPAEAAGRESLSRRLAVHADCFWLLADDSGSIISVIDGIRSREEHLRDEMYEDTDLHDPSGDTLMIFGVETLPEYQHRGMAKRLMEQVISDCRATGMQALVLTCKEALVPFYEQFGYVSLGVSGSAHGGVVWYEMRLTLPPAAG